MDVPADAGVFFAADGPSYRLGKMTLTFKRYGARDPCAYSVCLVRCEAGWSGARLHRHAYEEWHIQLEGVSTVHQPRPR